MQGWMEFPGGELEGRRTTVLCPKCSAAHPNRDRTTLCFECYRLGLARDRTLLAAAQFEAATPERFQEALPFEPVNRARLTRLRHERRAERRNGASGVHRFVNQRRRAQIEARHALDQIARGLRSRAERSRIDLGVLHAAELQFPESWLPFIVRRGA